MIRAKNTKTFGAAPKAPQFHKRRKPQEGEDLPALKNVMREIEGQNIGVEDFILLVAPHCGDKGAVLTKVMADDLNHFRRFCNEAYDTMTMDTNEVMATTQIELGQLYAERARLLTVNIINCMKMIHDFIPDFSLEEYNSDPERYLSSKFHILDQPDVAELDFARRQLAYHRLHWLQAEGDRLASENQKLQQRLNELKQVQQREIVEQITKEREADAQRLLLEQQQAEMQNQLQRLVDELLQTIVSEEEKIMGERKALASKLLGQIPSTGAIKKVPLKRKDSKWSAKAARDIEIDKINTTTASSASGRSGTSKSPKRPGKGKGGAKQSPQSAPKTPRITTSPKSKQKAGPKKKKAKKPVPIAQRPAWQDVEVDRSEVAEVARDIVDTPIDILTIGRILAPVPCTSPRTTCTSPRSRSPENIPCQARAQSRPPTRQPSPPRCPGRRAAGPRDTWGGFF